MYGGREGEKQTNFLKREGSKWGNKPKVEKKECMAEEKEKNKQTFWKEKVRDGQQAKGRKERMYDGREWVKQTNFPKRKRQQEISASNITEAGYT